MQSLMHLRPHPYRARSQVHGFSHGLKKCPPDTFLPSLRSGRPFKSLLLRQKEMPPFGGISFIYGLQKRYFFRFCVGIRTLKKMIYRLRDMIYGLCRMIYLLRKHDIISVLSYAAGIYHRWQSDIIAKIYHPFRMERISLKNDKFLSKLVVFHVFGLQKRYIFHVGV